MNNYWQPIICHKALFGGSDPIIPPKPKPVRMPNPDDPEILKAGKRKKQAAAGRSGRQATLLTNAFRGQGNQTLGA